MILAFVGNRFLIDEAARDALSRAGFAPRDVPWLDEDVTPEAIAPHLEGGLFGPAAVAVDVTGLKEYKPVLEAMSNARDAVCVLLDAENWTSQESSGEVARKRKAQESRAKAYEKAGGDVATLPTPVKGALVKWVLERAKAMKLKLEPDAARLLSEIFPDDPPAIAGELEKLSVLDGKVDLETVRRVVNFLPPTTVFAVLEAAAKRKPAEAADHLSRLLDAGEDPFKLMGAVQGQYQLNARAFALRERDAMVSPEEAGKALSVHPFRAQKALEAVRGLSEKRLLSNLRAIFQADTGMKSGSDPRLTLETLVIELSR